MQPPATYNLLPLQSSTFFIVRAVDLVIFGSMFFFYYLCNVILI